MIWRLVGRKRQTSIEHELERASKMHTSRSFRITLWRREGSPTYNTSVALQVSPSASDSYISDCPPPSVPLFMSAGIMAPPAKEAKNSVEAASDTGQQADLHGIFPVSSAPVPRSRKRKATMPLEQTAGKHPCMLDVASTRVYREQQVKRKMPRPPETDRPRRSPTASTFPAPDPARTPRVECQV